MNSLSDERSLGGADFRYFQSMRLTAVQLQPFLASAIFAMIPVTSPGKGTFGVDRHWRLYLDMETARTWGVEQAAGVLLHEANHLLRNHHERGVHQNVSSETAHTWNLACDAAINDDLVTAGISLPPLILPSTFGYATGGVEEQYYERLRCDVREFELDSCGSGAGGSPHPAEIDEDAAPSLDDVDGFAIREEVRTAIKTGTPHTTVPSGLLKWANGTGESHAPWQSLLRRELARGVRAPRGTVRVSWTRPHRRSDHADDILRPGHKKMTTRIAVVFDTSGSMDATLLDAAASELRGVLAATPGQAVTLITCDDHTDVPRPLQNAKMIHIRGGGGTDLRKGILAAAELTPRPQVVVVLTDGETPWPTEAPDGTRLIAVVIGGSTALPSGRGISSLRVSRP